MTIVYAPDGSPYEVPQGEVNTFIRKGFRTTAPTTKEAKNAPVPVLDTTKTGGVGSGGIVDNTVQQESDLIPALQEGEGAWKDTTGEVNVNSGSLKDLTGLPGVGTAIAKKIVENRPYDSAEDLIAKVPLTSGDWLALASRLTF